MGQGEEEGSQHLRSPVPITPESPSPPWPAAALIYPPARWVRFGDLLFPRVSPRQSWRGVRPPLRGRIAPLAGEQEQTEVLDRFPLPSPRMR